MGQSIGQKDLKVILELVLAVNYSLWLFNNFNH